MSERDQGKTRDQLVQDLMALQAENAALFERVARLEAVLDAIDDAVFVKDAEGRYLLMNRAAASSASKPKQEVVGKDDTELFSPDTARQFATTDRKILAQGVTVTFEEELYTKDVRRTFSTTKGPYRDDRGSVIGVIGIARDISESKRVEQALGVTQELLTHLLDHAPTAIFAVTREGRIRLVNRAWEKLWRLPREKVLGHTREEIFPPDLARRFGEQDRQITETETPLTMEEAVDAPDGRRYLWKVKFPLRNAAGDIEAVGGICLDTTEHKLAQLTFEENRRRLEALFNNTISAIWLLDDDRHVVEANPAACDLLGYGRDELLRMRLEDLVPPGDRELALERWQTLLTSGHLGGECTHVRKDGSQRVVDFRAVAHVLPGLHQFVNRDITEPKKIQVQRDQVMRQLRFQIKRLPLAYAMVDAEERVLEWNPAAERLFGYTREEVLGHGLIERIVPLSAREQVGKIVQRLQTGDMSAHSINQNRTKDGRDIMCEWFNTPIMDEDGRYAGTICLAQDVTERLRAEEMLARDAVLLANVRDAVMVTDLEGVVTYWNEGSTRLFGWQADEILGRPMTDRIPEEGRAAMLAEIRAIADGKEFSGEWEDYRKDGSRVWIDARVTRITDPSGRPLGLIGVSLDITDRKRTERALRASEHRLTLALQAARAGVWEWDIATNRTFWTAENSRRLGYTPGEVSSSYDNWVAAIHPEDRAVVVAKVDRAVEEKENLNLEYRVCWPDGTVHWLRDFSQLELDSQGQPRRMLGFLFDITHEKNAEKALRESEERFRFVVESIPHMVWAARPDGFVDYYNGRLLEYIGVAPEQLEGWNWTDFLHPDDRQRARAGWEEAVRNGAEFRIEYRVRNSKTGEYRWVLGHALPQKGPDGQVVRWFGTGTDIDERKRAEHELLTLNAALENAVEGIARLDLQARYLTVNPAYAAMLGYEPAEMIGMNCAQTVHPKHRATITTALRRMAIQGRTEFEAAGIRKDGSTFWNLTVMIPTRDEQGRRTGHYCFTKDVTRRKQAEKALRRYVKRLRVLSRRVVEVQEEERRHLARELHDEIGQTLTAISINLHSAKRFCSGQATAHLEECIAGADGAIHQVRHLSLDLRPSMLDDLGLVATLRWYLDRQAQRVGYGARLTADPDRIELDPTATTAAFRVVQEALTNVARHARAQNVWVKLRFQNGVLRAIVRDDGVGFDIGAFRRMQSAGEGLGLLGMRERATLVGGRVTIRSAPNHGTVVRLSIPVGLHNEGR